jgi:hypothetical protein
MNPASAPDLAADRATALRLTPASRETLGRLDALVALLLAWQRRTNLIANSTVPKLWTRHIADSLQLLDLAPAPGFGSTSAAAPVFRDCRSLVRWPTPPEPWSIWSRATPRRPRSCGRPSG